MTTGITGPRGSFGVLPHVDRIVPQDATTLLPLSGHGEAPTRFVMAIPTDLPMRPIRAYASLKSAATVAERVDLVVRELERQGAFRRKRIVIGAPTGGGHLNPVALELIERMCGGDVASVGIQFGTLPSMLSIGKVDDEREMLQLLMSRIRDRIRREHPTGGGPQVLLYGESLGGWASQGVLDQAAAAEEQRTGTPADPFRIMGIDAAVWIGIPGFSRFREQRLGASGMQAMSSIAQLGAIEPGAIARARAWELSHFDDPVHRADLATIWRRPAWLPKVGSNPKGVGAHERWRPLLTFLDSIKMAVTSANKDAVGTFTDHGHDYRKELPQLLRSALGATDVSDAELARITEQVRQSEVWIMGQEWK